MTYEPARTSPAGTQPPLIGISASEIRPAHTIRRIKEGEPPGHEIALGTDYATAIERAGGIPVVIPPNATRSIPDLIERIDGLCVSGGPDIDPVAYATDPSPDLGPTDAAVDRFELDLAREAFRRDLPVFAICRGMQILNVALSGSLIQHLPDITAIAHRQDEAGTVPGHEIEIEPGTRLAEAAAGTRAAVNTFHHQAIDRIGAGLEVTARAPDGTIEAIESIEHRFVVGVQWHAELAGPRDLESRLFADLVDAAAATARRNLEGASR